MLGETFLLRDGEGAAAEGESSDGGESHGEELFGSCRGYCREGGTMSFKPAAKRSGAGKDGGIVGLGSSFWLTGCFQETKVYLRWGKKKTETRLVQETKDRRWIVKDGGARAK